MMLRVGISRRQYQRLESKGNPRLNTLELIAKGLKSEILRIPQERLNAVKAVLAGEILDVLSSKEPHAKEVRRLSDDPWRGLLGEKPIGE